MIRFKRRAFLSGTLASFFGISSSRSAGKVSDSNNSPASAKSGVQPIIDMHVHAFPANGEKDYYGNPSPGDDEEMFQETYKQFREWNVVKAVVSGSLEHVEKWKSKDVDNRIIRGVFMESPDVAYPYPGKGGIEIGRFEELVKSGKIEVFGEIGPNYGGTKITDSGYQPYLEICERHDIPVCVHTGGMGPDITLIRPKARLSLCDPLLIEDVLVKYPNLRVYLAHAGEHFHEDVLALMNVYPNLYTDVSVLLWVAPTAKRLGREFLAKAKEDGFLDRVMFGSDQMQWPHAIGMSIEYLNSLKFLSEQDKRDILYNNAARFLKLDL